MATPAITPNEEFAQPYIEPGMEFRAEPTEPIIESAPVPEGPEIIDLGDGATVTIEKVGNKWRAALDSGVAGGVENFYGKTKNELFSNLAVAKLNATRKIRELNRKEKLGIGRETPAPQNQPSTPHPRQLTADEVFQIKNQLNADPALAFDTLFQKRTGMTFEQLTDLLQKGQAAQQTLNSEAVAKEFVRSHPDYYNDDANYEAIVAWLAKNKLGRTLTARNQEEIMSELYRQGHWNLDNLDEAFEDLKQDGLLVMAPAPAPPAPQPQDPRIVSTRRPRPGNLGIRTSETSQTPRPTTPVSAEDLSKMTDAQRSELLDRLSDQEIRELYEGARALRRQQRGLR